MLAVFATSLSKDDPLSGLHIADRPEPDVPEGWTTIRIRAAALNHHDIWSLRGVGLDEGELPRILGCDGAGLDPDGNDVIVHSVLGDPAAGGGDETLDPGRSILSERYDGTFAEVVAVPRRNLVPKPDWLSWAEAACLPTAWLTAYRMLFTRSGLPPSGATVLIQGAGGGVSTALILLAKAAGHVVFATSRSAGKRERAAALGADQVFEAGARLPARVDAVMETVGEATWAHSLRSLRPGGVVVVSGSTSGPNPPADLQRMFFRQLSVVGSTMGTRDELEALVAFLGETDVRPLVDDERPLADAGPAFERIAAGDLFGKLILTV